MGWYDRFLLGRPGYEIPFEVNPLSVSFEDAPIAIRQRNLVGDLKKSVIKTLVPTVTVHSDYLTIAQRNLMASLSGISETFLSFRSRDDWKIFDEYDIPTDSTHVTISNNSITKLSSLLVSLGFSGVITPTAVYTAPSNTPITPFSPVISNGVTDGRVTVQHSGGTYTTYFPSGSTDANNGTCLMTAFAACVTGDTLVLSQNTYDIGNNTMDLSLGGTGTVNITGQGKYLSTIKSNYAGFSTAVLHIASNQIIENLSLYCTSTSGAVPIGNRLGTVSETYTNCTIRNVYINGWSDCIVVNVNDFSTSTILVDHVSCYSRWDTTNLSATISVIIRNSDFTAVADPAINSGKSAVGLRMDYGSLYVYDSTMSASGGTTRSRAISGEYSSSSLTLYIELHRFTASSSGPAAVYDLYNDTGGSLNITQDSLYDAGKTYGVINVIPSLTNYFVGGSYNDATRVLTLGASLPTLLPVYVSYTYSGWLVDIDKLPYTAQAGWLDRFTTDFVLTGV